jgi:hypothetical protein
MNPVLFEGKTMASYSGVFLTVGTHTASIEDWAKALEVKPHTLYCRKMAGLSDREVIGKPIRSRERHGEAGKDKSAEYRAWYSMTQRCYNKNFRFYPDYGGRGITVCERWRHSFTAFLEDMGRKPTSKHTLERKENDGNYEPGNVRWATRTEQARNRRSSLLYTIGGVTKSLPEWCEQYGINWDCVWQRLKVLGWDIEKALTTPVGPNGRKRKVM